MCLLTGIGSLLFFCLSCQNLLYHDCIIHLSCLSWARSFTFLSSCYIEYYLNVFFWVYGLNLESRPNISVIFHLALHLLWVKHLLVCVEAPSLQLPYFVNSTYIRRPWTDHLGLTLQILVNVLALQLNYFLNTLLSLHMVIAFLVAVILDNTVPGSRQERGVYVWSETEAARREPAVTKDYELPFRVGRVFRWVKWVGLWETNDAFVVVLLIIAVKISYSKGDDFGCVLIQDASPFEVIR